MNVMGRVFLLNIDDPFTTAMREVTALKAAGAQLVFVDMHAEVTSEKIAMWLSGYHSGKVGNTSLDAQELSASARKLRTYCARNGKTLVMDAVEAVVAARRK